MQPMQCSSCAVYMGNQPSLFGTVRYSKTGTGQTLMQKPHALHMSSATTTSHLPAGPFDTFFSALNSAIPFLSDHFTARLARRPASARTADHFTARGAALVPCGNSAAAPLALQCPPITLSTISLA